MKAYLIVTDSGGIQEEAPSLGKPVLIVRDVTERPEVIQVGAAKLTPAMNLAMAATELLEDKYSYDAMAQVRHIYGDGTAASKIADIILAQL